MVAGTQERGMTGDFHVPHQIGTCGEVDVIAAVTGCLNGGGAVQDTGGVRAEVQHIDHRM